VVQGWTGAAGKFAEWCGLAVKEYAGSFGFGFGFAESGVGEEIMV
jgi:hypothetical protein